MKVLMLCWRDSTHPQGGGSERYLERVAEYLAAHGHQVTYRSAKHPGALRKQQRNGVTYIRAGGKFGVYLRAQLAIVLQRYRDVDVVIDTQNGVPFFARLFTTKPVILLTHHCHREQWPVAGPVLSRIGWWLESVVSPRVHRSTATVTVSQPSADELAQLGVPSITIIRNGIDPVPAAPQGVEKSHPHRLVTLCRLVPHKNIEHALDVLAAIDNTHLDIIGSGWWEDELKAYAVDLGVDHRVTFHGHVSETRKHQLLDGADIHLLPSRKEGWGLAVIEAAQHGVPTVGYHSSRGLQDSIIDGTTGLLVDNKAQLITSTRCLLDDAALRHRLGDAARIRATTFSWEKTGEQWEKLLEKTVAPPTGS